MHAVTMMSLKARPTIICWHCWPADRFIRFHRISVGPHGVKPLKSGRATAYSRPLHRNLEWHSPSLIYSFCSTPVGIIQWKLLVKLYFSLLCRWRSCEIYFWWENLLPLKSELAVKVCLLNICCRHFLPMVVGWWARLLTRQWKPGIYRRESTTYLCVIFPNSKVQYCLDYLPWWLRWLRVNESSATLTDPPWDYTMGQLMRAVQH